MESTPVSGKDGAEGSSQDNLLHAAKLLDEEGTNIVVVENEGGTSSGSGDSVPTVSSLIGSYGRGITSASGRRGRLPSHVGTGPSSTSHEWDKPCSASRPSFYRIPKPRKSLEMHVGDRMTNQYVPGRSVAIIRPRATSSQVNPQGHDNLVLGEDDEEIVEEEAICKICFDGFKEENTLKTVCRCKNALIHEECAAKWLREKGNNNCDFCGQKVENFPVTLLRGLSFTRRADAKERNKNSWFSCLTM